MTAWTTNQSVKREDFFTPAKLNENLVRKGNVNSVNYVANGTSEVEYTSNDNNIKYIMEVDQYGNVELQSASTVAGTNPTTTPSESDTSTNTTTDEETPIVVDTSTQEYKAQHPENHMPASTGWEHIEGTTVENGYVIKETKTGDEFVWIPVTGVSEDDTTSDLADNLKITYTKKAGSINYHNKEANSNDGANVLEFIKGDVIELSSILGTNVTSSLSNTPPEADVVNDAGGFWVSRYEIGFERSGNLVNGELTSDYWDNFDASNLKSVAGVEPVRFITQSQALSLVNEWKKGDNVQSGLITGTQWDVMCKFIGWETCDSDCTTWGNYYDAIGTISKGHSGENDTINDSTNHYYWTILSNTFPKAKDTRTVSATGSFTVNNSSTAQKNIYDVVGNVWEWTTEVPQNGYDETTKTGTNRVVRGGSANDYGYFNVATYRHGNTSGTASSNWDIGFRAVLYVK
jgi:hypothetical protein